MSNTTNIPKFKDDGTNIYPSNDRILKAWRNGFDLESSDDNGDLSWDDATRTFSIAVKSGQSSYIFWANSKKFTKETTESVVIPDVSGTYYIYFDNSGTLQYVLESSVTSVVFYEYAIVGLVYWNATTSKGMAGNERHGVRMSSATHAYNHMTFGARYGSGIDIEGLTDGGTTYTQTIAGTFFDEDIKHSIATQTTAPFLYRSGSDGAWVQSTPDNKVSYNNGGSYDVWNEFDGTTWKLTEGTTSTDFWIIFYIATPDLGGYSIKKIIGQNAYSTRGNARDAIESEIRNISTEGLPSPEFVFLYATIIKRDGTLKTLADGSTYLDLRYTKGGGGSSSAISNASDIATDTTNFNGNLSSTDTDIQTALETIDDITIGDMYNPMTTAGDIIYGGTSGTPTRLAKGTSGQVLTMGATNPAWEDASGGGSFTSSSTVFENLSRYTTTVNGSGSNSIDEYGLKIETGATAASSCKVLINNLLTSLATVKTIISSEGTYLLAGTDNQAYIGLGDLTVSGSSIDFIASHCGIKSIRVSSANTMYATNSDGTTETATSIATSSISQYYSIERNGTTNIKYYYNGTLLATNTTNLPTVTLSKSTLAISNSSVANDSYFHCGHYSINTEII